MASRHTTRQTAGGRAILVTAHHGFVASLRLRSRYYRLGIWQYGLRWHVGRSTS